MGSINNGYFLNYMQQRFSSRPKGAKNMTGNCWHSNDGTKPLALKRNANKIACRMEPFDLHTRASADMKRIQHGVVSKRPQTQVVIGHEGATREEWVGRPTRNGWDFNSGVPSVAFAFFVRGVALHLPKGFHEVTFGRTTLRILG